jgi:hypothetical protein
MYSIKIINLDESSIEDTFTVEELEDGIITFWNNIIQYEMESDLVISINTIEKSRIIIEASGFQYKAILSKD